MTKVLCSRSTIGKQSEIFLHGNQVDKKKLKKAVSRYDIPSLNEKYLPRPQESREWRMTKSPDLENGTDGSIQILSPLQQAPEIQLVINLPLHQSLDLLEKTCKLAAASFRYVLNI